MSNLKDAKIILKREIVDQFHYKFINIDANSFKKTNQESNTRENGSISSPRRV